MGRVGPTTSLSLPRYVGQTRDDDVVRDGIALGHGVYALPFRRYGQEDDSHAGINVGHYHEDGTWCEGGVLFVPMDGRPTWTVESWEPLTISPSVRASGGPGMTECLHGFIRNGRWEPC